MAIKLFDSELKVMDVLWTEGDMTAKQISDVLKAAIGWNMNTTYTVVKKCIANETMKMVMDDKAIEVIVSMLMELQDRENVNLPLYEQQLKGAF